LWKCLIAEDWKNTKVMDEGEVRKREKIGVRFCELSATAE